jgi:hypothetical protein
MAPPTESADMAILMSTRVPTSRIGGKLDVQSQDYFRQREKAEKLAAQNAASDEARRAHQELAAEYAARLGQLS